MSAELSFVPTRDDAALSELRNDCNKLRAETERVRSASFFYIYSAASHTLGLNCTIFISSDKGGDISTASSPSSWGGRRGECL